MKKNILLYDVDDTLFNSVSHFYIVYDLLTLLTYTRTTGIKENSTVIDVDLCKENLPKRYIYSGLTKKLKIEDLKNYLSKELETKDVLIMKEWKRKKENPYSIDCYHECITQLRDELKLPIRNRETKLLSEIAFSVDLKPIICYYDIFKIKKTMDCDLGVVTKGTYTIQSLKLERSGLKEILDRKHIQVLPEKDLSHWQELLEYYSPKYYKVVNIGNSLNDDILPIKKLGEKFQNANAVWYVTHDFFTHKKEYEQLKKSNEVLKYSLDNLKKLLLERY
ncbi:MAG: hypothetical protein QW524_00340 [Candidatus Woesearchaeota archaeon]